MVRIDDGCAGCGLPCIGRACPNSKVLVMVCDKCGDYAAELYVGNDGKELCAECALSEMRKVEVMA